MGIPRLILLFSILYGLSYFQLSAQPVITLAFNQKLGPRDGLSSYNASKILQDKFGFTWISTQDGLNRFDGNQFIVYNKTSKIEHRLLGNVINETIIDTSTNTLWVTTSYGGLNSIDLVTGKVSHVLKSEITQGGFHSAWLKCFTFCEGLIWIGTNDGITVYDPSQRKFIQIEKLPFDIHNKKPNTSFIFSDRNKNIWMFFPDLGMVAYSAKTKKVVSYYSTEQLQVHEQKSYLQFPGRITHLNDSSFILAVNNGFHLVSYNKRGAIQSNTALPVNKAIKEDYIYACAIDKSNRLWFSTGNKLLVTTLTSPNYITVKDIAGGKDQSEWLNFVSHIFFDTQNNLWLACQKGITYAKLVQPAFAPYFESENKLEKIGHVNYIYTSDDTILYACATDGLYSVNRISNEITNIAPKSASNYMFRNLDDNLIVSSLDGLFILKKGNGLVPLSSLYKELRPIEKEQINSAVIMGDSLVIMGSETNKGLFTWNIKKHTLDSQWVFAQKLGNAIINNLYKDSKNRIWILSDNSIGLWNVRNNTFTTIDIADPDLKIPLNILFDICEAKGYYWLAVYGKGVIQIDSTGKIMKTYSAAEGLLNTGVYEIFPYKDSLLFVTSNDGFFSLNLGTGKIHQYLTEDGLNTNHFEERCGFKINDLYYIGGVDGFSRVDPNLVTSNSTAPEIFITSLKTEYANNTTDTFNLELTRYAVASDVLQTTISFSAINYSNPRRVTYAYRIKGLRNDWTEIGSRNFISFLGLNPGRYVLEVRAANEDGLWGEPKQIRLHFLPKWHQTMLFKILVLLGVFGILYSFYRYRIKHIRKEQQIRKDIANDLHDDIGSTLNSVKIFTHLAKREPDSKEYLTNIEVSLTQASAGLRDMIWVLDDSRDTVYEVMERIKKFAQPICQANNISFHSQIELTTSYYTLTKTEKRNYLLIAKECITNSLKYSNCQNITIKFKLAGNKISLQTHDDGLGFDMAKTSEGNGLKNIAYRATQIRADCEIISNPEGGTTINILKK